MTSWEFPTEGPVETKIRIAAGSVAVTAAPTETVAVSIHASGRRGNGDDAVAMTEVAYHSGQLTITGPENSRLLRRSPGLDVAVTVPPGSACIIDTASGDIHCSGELARLAASSASGDISAERVTGRCEASTASGDVRLDSSGPAWVKSVSGDVRVDDAHGDVDCHTVSGDVKIGSVTAGEISVKTTSGDITVGVSAGTGVQLDLYTLSGDASSELEHDGPAGDASATVTCRSLSGDVAVRRAA